MRTFTMRYLLELMKKKYPGRNVLIIYDDESGRITGYPSEPYKHKAIFNFLSIQELREHLESS